MKKIYDLTIMLFLSVIFCFAVTNESHAQCALNGLNETYCLDSEPSILAGIPAGGTYTGPGVVGGVFYPDVAGVGTHTITYEYFAGTDKYYIKANFGNPWGNTSNNTAMDLAFGAGMWTLEAYETCVPATVFSSNTSFVFLEGSDGHASELNAFLSANLPLIEDWVDGGGAILINAAPNEGGSFSMGFGGTTLNYDGGSSSVTVTDLAHPAYLGPNTPTTSTMTGSGYSHGTITGTGYTNVLTQTGDLSRVNLCQKAWGSGIVMCGGMTTVNFHSPSPHAQNWRANLFVFLDEYTESGSCLVTKDVTVTDDISPDVVATSSESEICIGESYILTGSGADEFSWGGGITDGASYTPPTAGTYTHILTGISDAGCLGTDMVTIVVHPIPVVNAGLDKAQCTGMMVTLNGSGAASYTWMPAITNGVPFVVTSGDTEYTVTGTSEFGCVGTDAVIVEGIDYPTITAVVTDEYALYGASIDLTVTGGAGPYAYLWSHGPTTQDVSGLFEGSYMVTVDDLGVEDGKCAIVDSIFTIKRFVGIDEVSSDDLKVYPSPTTDNVTVSLVGNFTYELTAINGDVILNGSATDKVIVNLENLSNGTYIVKVTRDGVLKTVKVVKN